MIAEGVGTYGIELLFSEKERIDFEKEVIFNHCGLDTSKAELYYKIMSIVNKLNYNINTAAKNYLDGKWSEGKTIDWLKKYNLRSEESARKLIEFIKKYRTYIVNYSAGYDLIKYCIEAKESESEKWKLFNEIITTPTIPSNLEKMVYESQK